MSPLLGRRIAHFNRRVTNHLTRPLARWLPGFGVVIHTGRKSKSRYETPVNLFRTADGYLIALTYGAESDWVRNVLAAGGCEVITRGHRERLTSPEIHRDERQQLVPQPLRPILRLLRVIDFMHFVRTPAIGEVADSDNNVPRGPPTARVSSPRRSLRSA
jgi:deazaflavin-dependent oxidoreductase (nitroreductase family)